MRRKASLNHYAGHAASECTSAKSYSIIPCHIVRACYSTNVKSIIHNCIVSDSSDLVRIIDLKAKRKKDPVG